MNSKFSRRAPAVTAALSLVGALALVPVAEAGRRPMCFGRRATIVGTNGPDHIRGTNRADVIVTKGGRDDVRGRGGGDRICTGGGGREAAIGGGGSDRISLAGGAEEFGSGGGGNDVIDLGPGIFQFALGGAGDDQIIGFSPESGPTMDFAGHFNSPNPVTVNLANGTSTGHGNDTLISIEGAEGSNFNDTLTGNTGSNFLFGLEGNDAISAGDNQGDMNSPATVDEFRFDLMGGDAGDDLLTGAAGVNVIVHDLAPNGVTVDLQNGTSIGDGSDTLSGIQAVLGTRFNDSLNGDGNDNLFEGEGGTDGIDGRLGNDIIALLDAQSGQVDLQTGTASGTYVAQDGSNVPFNATLAGIENAWGSAGADVLTGNNGVNRLFGNPGTDQIFGLGGNDHLDGGPEPEPTSDNTLDGGEGTDTCVNGTATNCEGSAQVARRSFSRLSASWSGLQRMVALLRMFR